MVMSYLITSNAEYTRRVDEIESKIDILLRKLELLEYNISILAETLDKELDNVADIIRVIR